MKVDSTTSATIPSPSTGPSVAAAPKATTDPLLANEDKRGFLTDLAKAASSMNVGKQLDGAAGEIGYFFGDKVIGNLQLPLRLLKKLADNSSNPDKSNTLYHRFATLISNASNGKFGIATLDAICDSPGQVGEDMVAGLRTVITENEQIKNFIPNLQTLVKQNLPDFSKMPLLNLFVKPAQEEGSKPVEKTVAEPKATTKPKTAKETKGIWAKILSLPTLIKDLAGSGKPLTKEELAASKKTGGLTSMLTGVNPKVRQFGVYGATGLAALIVLRKAFNVAKTILFYGSGLAAAGFGAKKLMGFLGGAKKPKTPTKKAKTAADAAPAKQGWVNRIKSVAEKVGSFADHPAIKLTGLDKHMKGIGDMSKSFVA